jgi:hypothetical protein
MTLIFGVFVILRVYATTRCVSNKSTGPDWYIYHQSAYHQLAGIYTNHNKRQYTKCGTPIPTQHTARYSAKTVKAILENGQPFSIPRTTTPHPNMIPDKSAKAFNKNSNITHHLFTLAVLIGLLFLHSPLDFVWGPASDLQHAFPACINSKSQ